MNNETYLVVKIEKLTKLWQIVYMQPSDIKELRASGNSRGYICNQMRLRLEDCDKELIKEFFRKDNK